MGVPPTADGLAGPRSPAVPDGDPKPVWATSPPAGPAENPPLSVVAAGDNGCVSSPYAHDLDALRPRLPSPLQEITDDRFARRGLRLLLKRDDLRIISCHLGGSSSLCAIRAGKSMATSMGFSAQSGLPQNNRAGDFDPFALPIVMRQTGKTLDEVLAMLASQSGLAGLSGGGDDIRDISEAAENGNRRAQLALDVYVGSIRQYLGAYLVELGGAEAIVFTGGIGENRVEFRQAVCRDLEPFGIELDPAANQNARGEAKISSPSSRIQVWVVPTNEELIVARQTKQLLEG